MEFDLSRFIQAQQTHYETALREIRNGRKQSHWMWFIFPQLRGLGRSTTSEYYGIIDLEEARAFLRHPYLGKNLREITSALLSLDSQDAREVMGWPDCMKLKSSMTLFVHASEDDKVFQDVLEKYYQGREDRKTLQMLGMDERERGGFLQEENRGK